jgi:protein-disulfide isomerase
MSKRQEMRESRNRKQRNQRIWIIAIISIVVIAAALLIILPNLQPVGTIAENPLMDRKQVKFNTMGDPNAPVKIIEYSDFQCPYCANFVKNTEQQLIDAYVATGKVYFEYHSFGEFIGPESGRAAQAAYCAGDQNKFWDMHDILFANQATENSGAFTDKRLEAFAAKLGLDTGTFNDCLASGKYATQVAKDGADGNQAGVKATPSFVINGKLLEGAQPFTAFQTEIDALLK